MDTVISIQARLGSTRLPGKVLLNLGECRILDWVVHRASSADIKDADVVVALGDEPENEAIEELCRRKNYEYIVGSEDNLLDRHLKVAHSGNYDTLVRLTADCPFVPSAEIERLFDEHVSSKGHYTTNNTKAMPVGTAVDIIDRNILDELADEGEAHPVSLLHEESERWGGTFSPNPDWGRFRDVHMAVDTPGDYWQLVDTVNSVGYSPRAVAESLVE